MAMMGKPTPSLMVAADLAEILVADGAARTTFERRSEILRILCDGAATGSVAITLLQGPGVIAQAARGIKRWARERSEADPPAGKLTFESARGRVEFVIHPDTDIGLIVEILQRLLELSADDEVRGDEVDGLTV
jgi:hypothetical protein